MLIFGRYVQVADHPQKKNVQLADHDPEGNRQKWSHLTVMLRAWHGAYFACRRSSQETNLT